MKTYFIIAIALVLVALIGFAIGYWLGSQYANERVYWMGFESGQADGMSTAQAAYESGGEIVNLSTGQKTKKP